MTHLTPNGVQIPIDVLSDLLHYPEGFSEPRDASSKIKNFRNLHDQPRETLNIPHHKCTTALVDTLSARVKGEAGYMSEDINGIVVICHRLLTFDTSPDSLISTFQDLTQAMLNDFYRSRHIQSLDRAIECLREALKTCVSSLRPLSLNLANLLAARFLTLHIDNDYQEAKAVLHNIIASHPPGDLFRSYHIQASALTSAIGFAWSIINSNLKDSKGTVSRCRSFLDNCSVFGDPLHSVITKLLETHVERGSEPFEPLQSIQVVHSISPQLGLFGEGVEDSDTTQRSQTVPSLIVVEEKIRRLQDLRSTILPGTERQKKCLNDLVYCYDAKFSLTQDVTAIEESIKYRRMLVATTHPSDPSIPLHHSSFGNCLYLAFGRSKRVEYLNESITHHRSVLGLENARLIHFATIRRLIESLSVRRQLSYHNLKLDLDEIMRLFTLGVSYGNVTMASRFELACHWAYSARIYRHQSVLSAYKNAMSLMQKSLVFAPTLPIQHDRLVEKRGLYEKTPLNFASYYIRTGQLEQAIETLEQGRALLWSEMCGLRTSTDRLRAADPVLAQRFTAINQELEILTTSAFLNGSTEMDDQMAQLPGLTAKRHELLKAQYALITEIRGLPGLKDFLLPLPFDTLRSAASHGPVIIINHCKWRSDIIIVLHNSPPYLITTPYNFFDLVNGLKRRLLGERQRSGPGSKHYVRALDSVLRDLYDLVGGPVIKRLNELGIPEQSRVWWCPTSVFGYLPLHAMGPISSDGGVSRYFSDLYISSYTPTLSALITSRNSGERNSSPGLPSILLVAQPDPSLPGVSGEVQVVQGLNQPVTCLISQSATPSTVLDGLRNHQFCHFACHAALTTGKPFDTSLLLYEEEPLMLLDIVRSRLPGGECAFLATCHTAELSDESIPDEVLHLSAAMQYSGFRSVIGTMWEMADEDGQYLAKYFYESMFSDEGQRPYYERSAKALATAVRMLRARGVSLERWVNYAHFGA
jgi:tetratricopeptide (TPR) repeat protein